MSTLRIDWRKRLPESLLNPLLQLQNFFKRHYPEVRLYLVGGAVRDLVMGREVYDLDVECFGIDPERFDEAMERLGAKGVGRSFFVYKYGPLDVALPRLERKTGRGHRAFAVELARDTKEASRRRDFTMNALMLDLQSGEIIDHWGGVEDIRRRLIRVVDAKKFVEDSLRVLRAMQFSARLGFRIEAASCRLMRRMELDDLTPERIFMEFEKLFNAPKLHYGLYALHTLAIDEKILGFSFPKSRFFITARHMLRARRCEEGTMHPYYFLFILSSDLKRSSIKMCEAIHTPNIYKKVLGYNKRVPHRITDRFLGASALRYPIRQWLGIYADGIPKRAKKLGIYHQRFDPGIRPADLMEEGFEGAALGKELKRRILAAVRQRFGLDLG